MTTTQTQYAALVAALGTEERAQAALKVLHPAAPAIDPRIQALMDAGFSAEDAARALATPAAPAAPVAPPAPKTSKEVATALYEAQGFTPVRGRLYAGPELAEAIVRVYKTGKPEIVASSGVGRTKAIVAYKEASGDVALQNLAVAVPA